MTQRTTSGPHSLENLRLQAKDREGIHFLSAHVQDALIPVSSFRFHKEKNRLHFLANRFRWELEAHKTPSQRKEPLFYRIHAAFSFGHVTNVTYKGFNMHHPTEILYLLAMQGEERDVVLYFAGDCSVKIHTEKTLCRMRDMGEHWPTSISPRHAA